MSDHVYSSDFYNYIDVGSRASAKIIIPSILEEITANSLLDIGSGHGAWAAEWMAAGLNDLLAIDGNYVSPKQLCIPLSHFRAHDLSTPLDLRRRFDLVQSLEVAEHLPPEKASLFIETLVHHGDVILFSAAVPYQGGEHHLNEQPPEYWRNHFLTHGYKVFDWLRPHLANQKAVKPWYRFNCFIYANAAGETRLSSAVRQARVPDKQRLEIGGNIAWRLRRLAVRFMPAAAIEPMAILASTLTTKTRTQL